MTYCFQDLTQKNNNKDKKAKTHCEERLSLGEFPWHGKRQSSRSDSEKRNRRALISCALTFTERQHQSAVFAVQQQQDLSQKEVFLWSLSKANIRFSRSASSHLAVRSGLGSVVAAVSGLWRDSWWKAEWRSGCRRRWNLDGPIRQQTSTSGWQRKHGDNQERVLF